MNPMVVSEKPWQLRVTFSKVESENVSPERLASSCIFSIADSAVFEGTHEMSMFNFDSFSCTLLGADADRIRVGVIVRSKDLIGNKRDNVSRSRLIFVDCRTRLINSITANASTPSTETLLKEGEVDLVRTQRYTKKYKSSIPKLPMNYMSQSYFSVEQKVATTF